MSSYDDIIEALTDKQAEPWTFPDPQAPPIRGWGDLARASPRIMGGLASSAWDQMRNSPWLYPSQEAAPGDIAALDRDPHAAAAARRVLADRPIGGRTEVQSNEELNPYRGMAMGALAAPVAWPVKAPALAVGGLLASTTPAEAGVAGIAAALERAAAGGAKGTDLLSLRGKSVPEAVKIARQEPHLIPAGKGGAGAYVGGPRDVKTYEDLKEIRKAYDAYAARDLRGADWYDRTRADISRVTGSPQEADWMSRMHAQWSAGVSPESELAFALKENNAALAGTPQRAYRGPEHRAMKSAIEEQDPSKFVLGEKTGEYQTHITPLQEGPPTAVGTSDFRHARNFGYTEASGAPQREGMHPSQHRFLDYETALAVDRANKAKLGGRTDWTGEAMQAAPWVVQKAEAIAKQRGISYEEAFAQANKTIGDFYPKHRAFATYEQAPGVLTGHLPGYQAAPAAAREEFSSAASWTDPTTGRDKIYGGYRIPNTGVAMRVEPSVQAQGVYTNPLGELELNPGMAARPLVGFRAMKGGEKAVPRQDRALLDAAELSRGLVDVQQGGAWHKNWFGGPANKSRSFFMDAPQPQMGSLADIAKYREIGGRYGRPDVSDTGQGITVTKFGGTPRKLSPERTEALTTELRGVAGVEPKAVKTEGNYLSLDDPWARSSVGSQRVVRSYMDQMKKAPPQIYDMINNNPAFAEKALANLARDEKFAAQMGGTRSDVANMHKIIGKGGPGWLDRLDKAIAAGASLPAAALVLERVLRDAQPSSGDL